jgi:pyruvate formate lyase activating enzyme
LAETLKDLLAHNTMAAAPELVGREEAGALRCLACGHRCHVTPGASGVCRVRFNQAGELRVPAGYVSSLQVDPIEKKPFFHAFPGREALSFGMLGCDLHCPYCQNWITSQVLRDDAAAARPHYIDGRRMIQLATERDVPVVVSTYNEPLITSEWAVEIFRLAKEHGIVCGFVSNGNGTPEVLSYLRPHMDLFKIDLKGFRDRPYRELGGVLQNVLDTIVAAVKMGFWVEVVTLVVPKFNDSNEELRDIARFLAGISPFIPWHVTAFHPDYHMDSNPPTSAATLRRAYDAGKGEGLHFVYAGNLPGRVGDLESTFCPGCERALIERTGFRLGNNALKDGLCPHCGFAIPGRWGSGIVHPLPGIAPADKSDG